jgi:8-oxo-dGTP pyrophosphatase MutT (NUDIX family)
MSEKIAPEAGSRPRVDSAVLVPVFRDSAGELQVVLIRRSEGGSHGGHIAFPGGKKEAVDRSMRETALREADEEIGLAPASVAIVADLPPMDTRTTGFRIYPFLARIQRPAQWQPNGEVAEVLEVPILSLSRPEARGEEMMQFEGWKQAERVPFLRIDEGQIWGATYRILTGLIPRVLGGEWPL